MKPLVTVIMPVRDGGIFLAEAVDSILGQSHGQLELLLVDDHSSDGAVGQIESHDPRLRLLVNRGTGVSAAFNTGLAVASGHYIARMDADDIALPERLSRQVAYLENHPELALCGGCVEIFAAAGVAGGNRRYQDWLNGCRSPDEIRREIFIESPIPNPTALFRRDTLEALGGYADPQWPEDYDLFLRADARGMRMGKPKGTVLRWREHEHRLTRTDGRYDLKRFQAAKVHYLAQGRLRQGVRPVIWGAGPTGRLTHDLLEAEGRAVRGFIDVHPRRIGGEKRGLPVWSAEWLREQPDAFVLAAVGAAGARDRIRSHLSALGRVEGEDHLFLA
ncbi:MAG: glycosyltransferase [Xanthomonadales bacterium]|nr:glycosyltransferase [Xanthomonadales bacterium]